uniref:Serine/threonine-protein kinase TOR n=1 Tax=Steinernema glaseri TaxID=37863 RepID=A0A1I8AV79_9BILA
MFWEEQQNNQSVEDRSRKQGTLPATPQESLYAILQKPSKDIDLTEILDHEYVLSEMRYSTDHTFMDYFLSMDIQCEFIHTMLDPDKNASTEDVSSYGRASKCSSLIGIKNHTFVAAMTSNHEVMKYLQTYLVKYRGEYTSLHAQYYKDALISFIEVSPADVFPYLLDTSDVNFINTLIESSYESSISELLLYLLQLVPSGELRTLSKTQDVVYQDIVEWLDGQNIPEKLIDHIDPTLPCLVHENASYVYREMLRAIKRKCEDPCVDNVTKTFYQSFYNVWNLRAILERMCFGSNAQTGGARSAMQNFCYIMNELLADSFPVGCPAEEVQKEEILAVLPGLVPRDRSVRNPNAVFLAAVTEAVAASGDIIYAVTSKILGYLQHSADSTCLDVLHFIANLANTNDEDMFDRLAAQLGRPLSHAEFPAFPPERAGRSLLANLFYSAHELPNFTALHGCVVKLITYILFSKPDIAKRVMNLFEDIKDEVDWLISRILGTERLDAPLKAYGYRLLLTVRGGILFSSSSQLITSNITEKLASDWNDFCEHQLNRHIRENKPDSAFVPIDESVRAAGNVHDADGLRVDKLRVDGGFSDDFPPSEDMDFTSSDLVSGENPFDNGESPFLGGDIEDPFASTTDNTAEGDSGWAEF